MIKLSGPTVNATNLELVTLAQAKAYLKLGNTSQDTILQTLLDNTHRQLYSLLGNRQIKFVSSSPYIYLLDGSGTGTQQVPQWPIVTSTVSISWGYVEDKDNAWHEHYAYADADWYANPDEGLLLLTRHACWPVGTNNLKVQFEAGYQTIPQDLLDAVCQWVAVKFQRLSDSRWDYAAYTMETTSYQYMKEEIPAGALAVIRSYERLGQGLGL